MKEILRLGVKDWITGIGVGRHFGGGVFYVANGINPFIDTNLGSDNLGLLQPCDGGTQVGSGTVDENPVALIQRDNTEMYVLGTGGDIYSIDLSDDSATLKSDRAVTMQNGFFFESSGTQYFYYVNDSTNIGRYDLASTYADDHFAATGNLENTTIHPVHSWAQKYWIGNKQYIASLDNTETLTLQALDLDAKYTVKALSDDDYRLVIGASTQTTSQVLGGESKIFFWDGFSASWNKEWFVPEPSIQGIQRIGSLFYAVCGRALYAFNYSNPPKKILDLDTTHSMNVNSYNAIGRVGDALLWGATDINMYGSLNSRLPDAYSVPFIFALRETSCISMNTQAAVDKIYIGGNDSKMYKVSLTSGGDTSGLSGITRWFELGRFFHINGIRINFGARLASGDDVSLTVGVSNKETSAVTQQVNPTFASLGAVSTQYYPLNMDAYEVRFTVGNFNGGVPKVKDIILYGEPITNS